MSRSALLLCLLATGCGAAHPPTQLGLRRRLDGVAASDKAVDIKQFPWQVSLEEIDYGRLRHVCGGSIISSTWVLTAAHCIDHRTPQELYVRAGSSFREFGGYIYSVANITTHEHYNRHSSRDYDFGLLEISEPFFFGSNAQAVTLGSAEIASRTEVNITCWGTNLGGDPVQLRVVTTSIADRDTCKATYARWSEEITERMICTSEEESGEGACAEEGGAPLVVGGTQYGLFSWGSASTTPGPLGVYSYVTAERSWITEKTGV